MKKKDTTFSTHAGQLVCNSRIVSASTFQWQPRETLSSRSVVPRDASREYWQDGSSSKPFPLIQTAIGSAHISILNKDLMVPFAL